MLVDNQRLKKINEHDYTINCLQDYIRIYRVGTCALVT